MIMALLSTQKIEDSVLLGCDAVLQGKWLQKCSFKTSGTICSMMQSYNPKHGEPQSHCCKNFITCPYRVDSQLSVLNSVCDFPVRNAI
jgi:hypothetical protein